MYMCVCVNYITNLTRLYKAQMYYVIIIIIVVSIDKKT